MGGRSCGAPALFVYGWPSMHRHRVSLAVRAFEQSAEQRDKQRYLNTKIIVNTKAVLSCCAKKLAAYNDNSVIPPIRRNANLLSMPFARPVLAHGNILL